MNTKNEPNQEPVKAGSECSAGLGEWHNPKFVIHDLGIKEAEKMLTEFREMLEHANSLIECLKNGDLPTESANAYLEWRDWYEALDNA